MKSSIINRNLWRKDRSLGYLSQRFLTLLAGLILFASVVIMSVFKPVKLWELSNERIGHFIADYFEHKYLFPTSGSFLNIHFFSSAKVSNVWWGKFVKRNFLVLNCLRYTITFYQKFNKHKTLSFFVRRIQVRPSTLYNTRFLDSLPTDMQTQRLEFSIEEEKKARAWLSRSGIKSIENLVCLLVRDSKYLEEQFPLVNWSYHSYRDSKIENYTSAIHWLVENGYTVLRMGKSQQTPVNLASPNFLDYAFSRDRSDFMDIWLFANCKMIISTGSGLDILGVFNHIPILFLNYLPFSGHHQYAHAMVVPKLLRHQRENYFLNPKEVYSVKYDKLEDYLEASLEVLDLPPDLVRSCVQEFVEMNDNPKVPFAKFLQDYDITPPSGNIHPLAAVSKTWLDYLESGQSKPS